MSGAIILGRQGQVATVTLSHPGKLNAMSRAMWGELRAAFEQLQRGHDVTCVLVCGQRVPASVEDAGHFCAGGDISEYADFRFDEASLRDFHENDVWGGLRAMLDCDIPIVAQIEGNCMGAGMEIASCCDIRVASETARFGAPIAKLGFPMAPREAVLVMRAAGELTAREMLLSAAVLDAAEMKQRGFLSQVVPVGEVARAALAYAGRISQLAPQAARLNKQTFRALVPAPDPSVAANLIASAYAYATAAEHREGVMAFVEKRQPRFVC